LQERVGYTWAQRAGNALPRKFYEQRSQSKNKNQRDVERSWLEFFFDNAEGKAKVIARVWEG